MTTTPTVFNFNSQEIRTLILNNEPWFVAEDICYILGLKNVSMALKPLDEDERSKFNLGRQGEVNIISESGMYTLVLRSRDAVKQGSVQHKFRKWVTNEVLPSIRKTGNYYHNNSNQRRASTKVMPYSENERYLVRILISDSAMKSTIELLGKGNSFKCLAIGISKTLGIEPLTYKEIHPDLERMNVVSH